MIKNEKGIAAVESTLITLILIILIGVAYFVVHQNQNPVVKNSETAPTTAKGVEGITNKGLEEEMKIEDQQASKAASSATDEVSSSSDLEGAYEAGF